MRKFTIILAVMAFLAIGAYTGRQGYRTWKGRKALQSATVALKSGDYGKASLWLRRAISADEKNIAAVRMMGDFASLMKAPAEVYWRQRLMNLQPTEFTNRLLLANACLAHNDYVTAKEVLDGVDARGRQAAEFFKVSAALALATGHYEQAEAHCLDTLKLQPDYAIAKLNLASIRIRRTDPKASEEARALLESLVVVPEVSLQALRHLTSHALEVKDLQRASAYSERLMGSTNLLFSDRLLRLTVLASCKSPLLATELAGLQRETATNRTQTFGLGRWMLESKGAAPTLAWLRSLPADISTNLPVAMVVADAYQGVKDWRNLQQFVSQSRWGELEFLRFAFLSRSIAEQGLATAAKAEWSKAMQEAAGRLDRLNALKDVAIAWRWLPQVEQVLWDIVNRFPAEKSAVQSLANLLYIDGKTRSLLTLYAQALKADPKNLGLKNNLAYIALLLNAEQYGPHVLAAEISKAAQGNPSLLTTYALSLHLQKKSGEALRLMSQFPPESFKDPHVAGYYGLFLEAGGEMVKSKPYFELAASALLLPEERLLFRPAKRL